DPDGKPVPYATVWRHWQRRNAVFFITAKTDLKGEFLITEIELPGPWTISASPPASWPDPDSPEGEHLGWAQTYYPGVTDPLLATKVLVPAGDRVRLDIKLA